MQKIKLWSVTSSGSTRKATAVADIDTTETEQQLEDLLVNSPDLLMDNFTLGGRQLPTEGGSLDLLGVDADGRLVVFELKRGTLTRDAVAQALDYASDLAVLGEDKLARLIDEYSGQKSIEAREGFTDWYQQEFSNEVGPLTNPDLPAFFGPPITGEQRQSAWLSRSRVLLGQREPASPASAHRHPSQHGAAL